MAYDALDVTIIAALASRSTRLGDLAATDDGVRSVVRRLAIGAGRWARHGGATIDVATARIDGAVYAHDGSSFRLSLRRGEQGSHRQNKLADGASLAADYLRSGDGLQSITRAVAWYLRWKAAHKDVGYLDATWRPSGGVLLRLQTTKEYALKTAAAGRQAA